MCIKSFHQTSMSTMSLIDGHRGVRYTVSDIRFFFNERSSFLIAELSQKTVQCSLRLHSSLSSSGECITRPLACKNLDTALENVCELF